LCSIGEAAGEAEGEGEGEEGEEEGWEREEWVQFGGLPDIPLQSHDPPAGRKMYQLYRS
jgi:hypothetical protein